MTLFLGHVTRGDGGYIPGADDRMIGIDPWTEQEIDGWVNLGKDPLTKGRDVREIALLIDGEAAVDPQTGDIGECHSS